MKLTRKQKAFADKLLSEPKQSATEAAAQTYNVASRKSAEVIASENLRNPAIQIYLEEHVDKAKNRVVELINSEKEEIALRASDSVLNRALGMPTQRTENRTEVVTINLDLTGVEQG